MTVQGPVKKQQPDGVSHRGGSQPCDQDCRVLSVTVNGACDNGTDDLLLISGCLCEVGSQTQHPLYPTARGRLAPDLILSTRTLCNNAAPPEGGGV